MPLAKESVILGINDAKMSPITVDDSTALTYGTAVDVPGITNIKVSPTFIEKELRGDESLLDQYTRLDYIDWSFENAILSLDALAILEGGTVTSSGTTPNQKQTHTVLNTDLPKYFKLEGKSDYTDMGDAHIVLYKCKCSKVDYSFVSEDYVKVSASGKAIGTTKDKKIKDVIYNETATAIA